MTPMMLIVLACLSSPEPNVVEAPAEDASPVRSSDQWRREADRLKAFEETISTRRSEIKHELTGLKLKRNLGDNEWALTWAGEYYVGDGLGMNVTFLLAPKSGVLYTNRGCTGLYDGNAGPIEGTFDADDDGTVDGIRVNWQPREGRRRGYDSERLYFVTWGEEKDPNFRRYLVPESLMPDFVNDFNTGGFGRSAQPAIPVLATPGKPAMRFTFEPPPRGVPHLPKPWADMLLLDRLEGTITVAGPAEVGDSGSGGVVATCPFEIDKGSADGVFVDMTIDIHAALLATRSFCHVRITSVQEHTASGVAQAFADDEASLPVPEVGQVLKLAAGLDAFERDD